MKVFVIILAMFAASLSEAEQYRVDLSGGPMIYKGEFTSNEVYARLSVNNDSPISRLFGVSVTNTDDIWAGAGWSIETQQIQTDFYVQASFMVGAWSRGNGPVLGFPVEFRSGVEVGYQFDSGIRLGISYDHRSNAGLGMSNAGVDTLQIRIGVPINTD